jgi:hypothetical protein
MSDEMRLAARIWMPDGTEIAAVPLPAASSCRKPPLASDLHLVGRRAWHSGGPPRDRRAETARLMPIKTRKSFVFAFQPSLDLGRILAWSSCGLELARGVLKPPSASRLSEPESIFFRATLAEIIETISRGELDGRLRVRLASLPRAAGRGNLTCR